MEKADLDFATATLSRLRGEYSVDVITDWGEHPDGSWQNGLWTRSELERLQRNILLLASAMGGSDRFVRNLNHVTIQKVDIGMHGGEALAHKVSLSTKRPASAWTIVHELAHTWDANHGWGLSIALEKYTGGFTSNILGLLKRFLGRADASPHQAEKKPGRYGRLPGCNAAGYFYGDKPSGSDWNFNRKEDFAECVAMFIGWKKNNDLSEWAEARINLHLLENGASDKRFGVDNWADYKKYFYPDDGDYSRTLRWKFIDELMAGKIELP
jgi:hypothetical protein